MRRVPDLVDGWFDSGSMPYAQWHYPFENKKIFSQQFPADFIVEAIDQTRGWFWTLLAVSTLLGKEAPYKNVLVLGHVLDEKGKKMSKSKGNAVSPDEAMNTHGVDALRWYFAFSNTPGESMSFVSRDVGLKLQGFIGTLMNCLRFYQLYDTPTAGANESAKPTAHTSLDRWILSRWNRTVKEATEGLDAYDVPGPTRAIEKFVIEDFSNWWLRRSRKRKEALPLLRYLLIETTKLIAPIAPFLAEEVYLQLRDTTKDPISVHLAEWPSYKKGQMKDDLESEMEAVRQIVATGLAKRKELSIKVRQPLASVTVTRKTKFKKDIETLLMDELNVKKVKYVSGGDAVVLDTTLTEALQREGLVREFMRQIQDMRKEAGYDLNQEVYGQWDTENASLAAALTEWTESIKKDVLFSQFVRGPHDTKPYDIEKVCEVTPDQKVWVGIRK